MTNLARRFPIVADERVALISDDGGQVSYGALGEMVGAVRGGLADAGLALGDAVMIVGANTDLTVVFHLACVTAGLVSMPVDPRRSPPEIARLVSDHRPAAVIADSIGATAWAESLADVTTAGRVFTTAEDRLALLDHAWVPGTEVDDDHPAVVSVSSASTRVVQTHGDVATAIDAMASRLPDPTESEATVLVTGPLHEPTGIDTLHTGLALGATIMIGSPSEPNDVDGDDVIVVSGFAVSAAEVERALSAHELVDAVSVVAEPDATTGERLVAYVATTKVPTLDERSPLERALIEFCAERLEGFKVPRRIVFTSSIRTELGDRRRKPS